MKCFLSHSSKDKDRYVRLVADKLSDRDIVYDEFTFEIGKLTLEEIIGGIDQSSLFVLFLSKYSVESEWVKKEIFLAKDHLHDGTLNRIFPIIIDNDIDHRSDSIPNWIKERYNLKFLPKPTIAARKIIQSLQEISWVKFPRLLEKEKLFIGRNEIINSFEERLADYQKTKPVAIFASGIVGVGRRALMRHLMIKTNHMTYSHQPLKIHLSVNDGIDGFLVKLYDLGVSSIDAPENLMSMSITEKIKIGIQITKDICSAREIVLVDDNQCLIDYSGRISSWFYSIISENFNNKIAFLIASARKFDTRGASDNNFYYPVSVPALSSTERSGLLKASLEADGITIDPEDFENISNILTGYPEQVYYAKNMILDKGINHAKNNMSDIAEYSYNKISNMLQKYIENDKALSFLRFLSEYEVISYEMIRDICGSDPYFEWLSEFVASSICDELGSSKEYVRVNDIVRDFILRNKLRVDESYSKKMLEMTKEFIQKNMLKDADLSQRYNYITTAIDNSIEFDEKYMIPAYSIMTIRKNYSEKRYADVIRLSDKLLERNSKFDDQVIQDVRYFLCQALARTNSNRFMKEVSKIKVGEREFLKGFFYRHQGVYGNAERELLKAMSEKRSESRARRELVIVYQLQEDWDKALDFARTNFNQNRQNPYHIQAYFECLIHQDISDDNRTELERLMASLQRIGTEKSFEMLASAEAKFSDIYDKDLNAALIIINQAIERFSGNIFPIKTKIQICIKNKDSSGLKECLVHLGKKYVNQANTDDLIAKVKGFLRIIDGDMAEGIRIIESGMRSYSKDTREKHLKLIRQSGQ